LFEQQSLWPEHEAPIGSQVWEHAGSVSQSGESEQSVTPSQSSSTPSLQKDSLSGGSPQSLSQEQESSIASQTPSPQTGGGPQSISQLEPFSIPSQVESPQHEGAAGRSEQTQSPLLHMESLQLTGPWPPPAPQQ
jgi:hypothetical protein